MIREEWGGGITLAGLTLNMLSTSMVVVLIFIVHMVILVAPSSLGSVQLDQIHFLGFFWDNYLRSGGVKDKGKVRHVTI